MECPYKIPLKAYYGTLSKMWMVKDAEGKVIFFDISETQADYIVQAINSHEKLIELLRYPYNLPMNEAGDYDENVKWKTEVEQALEAEKS